VSSLPCQRTQHLRNMLSKRLDKGAKMHLDVPDCLPWSARDVAVSTGCHICTICIAVRPSAEGSHR
jgi:hypothetical protein